MLDQRERCHGFEHRDLYFLTFAGSFQMEKRHRRGVERDQATAAVAVMSTIARLVSAGKIDDAANVAAFAQVRHRLVDLVELVVAGNQLI
jgi:hypothetical protein